MFVDRYHVEAIKTVAGTRHALNYVLNNWRKHREDRGAVGLYDGRIDPFSSGIWFMGWKERTESVVTIPPGYDPPAVSRAQSWLLSTGFQLGPPISCFAVPGAR